KSRVYGAANPTFDGSLSGVASFDNITAVYSTTVPASAGVGTYSGQILATLVDPTGRLSNYTVTNTPGTLAITKASASVTPNAASGGDSNADAGLTGTLGGFLAAEAVYASYSRTAGGAGAGGA